MKNTKTFAFQGIITLAAAAIFAVAQPALALSQESFIQNAASSIGGTSSTALNWSGYVAQGSTYTGITGTWIVPTIPQTSTIENGADATWVGIGGVEGQDLIQAGTETLTDSTGAKTYQAWYETLPSVSQPVPLTISPGDSVTVSINETNPSTDMWTITFVDTTSGHQYSQTVQYDSSLSSAEWIEELPVDLDGIMSLDNFGTLDFTHATAVAGGASESLLALGAQSLTMTNTLGQNVAVPSAIGTDNESFSVERTSANASPLVLTRRGIAAVTVGGYDSSGYAAGNGQQASSTTGYGNYGYGTTTSQQGQGQQGEGMGGGYSMRRYHRGSAAPNGGQSMPQQQVQLSNGGFTITFSL